MGREILDVENLTIHYHTPPWTVKAVDNISLRINQQEAVGIVGESGCGKSTIARSLMRLLPRQGKIIGGEVVFRGQNLLKLSDLEMRKVRGKEIAMVFQDPMTYLNPVMRVGDQIAESILLHEGNEEETVKEQVIEQLEKVQIPSPRRVADYFPHQLSGGMRQRVMIAMAICCNPSLLIADEPTTALDVTIQAQILDLFKDLIKITKSSLLLITHNLGIVAELCDKIYIMYAGKIVEYGRVFGIFAKPCHPYTAGLMNSILTITETKGNLPTIEGSVPNLANPPSGCRFHPRCPQANMKCSDLEPPPFEIEEGHVVFCWKYEG